jgi:hypothetical protein
MPVRARWSGIFRVQRETPTIDSGNSDIALVPADDKDVQVTRQVDGWGGFGDGPDATWGTEDGT